MWSQAQANYEAQPEQRAVFDTAKSLEPGSVKLCRLAAVRAGLQQQRCW